MSKYTLKNRLNDNKKDIIKDACIFAGGTIVTIAGVFGVIHFGKELIDFYQSGETLTFATRFAADWEEAKVGFSAIPSIIGGMVSYNSGMKLKDDISYRKVLKKELKEERRTY
ncbi:MAG: hypothetical protein IJA30_02935 [Bacilli bacterium]|nr:hypothetical protein [Bacilli bacterium]